MKPVLHSLTLAMPLLALALQGWAACPMHSVPPRSGAVAAHEHCAANHSLSGTPHTPKTPRAACCDLTGCTGVALLPNPLPPDVLAGAAPVSASLPPSSAPSHFNGRLERPPKPVSL